MFSAAYARFSDQFADDPRGGYLYYRTGFVSQRRTGFGPVAVSEAEAEALLARFKWTARGLALLTVLVLLVGLIQFASIPGIGDEPATAAQARAGTRAALATAGAVLAVLVVLGLLVARAWGRPQRVLGERPALFPDPHPDRYR